jgi:hypothetical protein
LLKDDGTVNYYLSSTDSTKTETGSAADLTGASGMVMVEIPAYYSKYEFDGTDYSVLLSEYALPGFKKVRKIYKSAYHATVDRTTSTYKLASVVNTTASFRGGNNTSTWDDTYRSLLGMPATSISLTNFRAYARNRGTAGLNGAGWNCDLYEARQSIFWLFVVEYATRNCQAAFNAEPDANGYKQGGLGPGVTEINGTKWSAFNGYNPFIPCGITNSLGNKTGVVTYTMPDEYNTGVTTTVSVPSYRGIENPFGHIWSWTDGILVSVQSADGGGRSILYTCDDPAKFSSTSVADYREEGDIPRGNGFIKTYLGGSRGIILPKEVGGGSTTYGCDYFYTSVPTTTTLRGVLFGGSAVDGGSAGLSNAGTYNVPTNAGAHLGSRLCFIPASE